MEQHAEAVRVLRHGVDTWPDHGKMVMKLAWVLATAPQDELRNGEEALHLAQRACELDQNRQAQCLDTLAAAYAETGQFSLAIETGERAVQTASSAGDTNLAQYIQSHLVRYQRQQPIRLRNRSGTDE